MYIKGECLSWKDTTNTNPIDTCEALKHNMWLSFEKVATSDANNCKYKVYYHNSSDSFNFNVPIGLAIQSQDSLIVSNSNTSNFEFLNYQTQYGWESYWLPKNPMISDSIFLGYFQNFCDSSRIIYHLGMRDCYVSDTLTLRCRTCDCCNQVNANIAPITTQTLCRVRLLMNQVTVLPSGETCYYYGLRVTGGFTPTDNMAQPAFSVPYNNLNPQAINFQTYSRQIANQFMNIYCYPACTYCLHLTYQNILGEDVCSKDICITIDNSQLPVTIFPSGAIAPGCYSIQPAKPNIPTEDLHFEQEIIVDPNPTTGKANVRLNLKEGLIGRLVLYSSTGEQIQEIHNGKFSAGFSDYEIDLSSQPAGMYIITIETDGMSYIKKFDKE
jgi:hypothetical protein